MRPSNNNFHLTHQECNECHRNLPIDNFECIKGKSYRRKCEACRSPKKYAQRLSKTSKSPKTKNKTPIIQEKPAKIPMKQISPPVPPPNQDFLKHVSSVLKNLLERVDLLEQAINNKIL